MRPAHHGVPVSNELSLSVHPRRNYRSRERGYLLTPGNPSAVLSECCNLHRDSEHTLEHLLLIGNSLILTCTIFILATTRPSVRPCGKPEESQKENVVSGNGSTNSRLFGCAFSAIVKVNSERRMLYEFNTDGAFYYAAENSHGIDTSSASTASGCHRQSGIKVGTGSFP